MDITPVGEMVQKDRDKDKNERREMEIKKISIRTYENKLQMAYRYRDKTQQPVGVWGVGE